MSIFFLSAGDWQGKGLAYGAAELRERGTDVGAITHAAPGEHRQLPVRTRGALTPRRCCSGTAKSHGGKVVTGGGPVTVTVTEPIPSYRSREGLFSVCLASGNQRWSCYR